MATFADFSLFSFLAPVFMFLLVFAVIYGFLNMVKLFKGLAWANGVHALIALTAAVLVVGNLQVFTLIATMLPWFTVLIIFLFLAFFVVRMFSGPDDKLFKDMVGTPAIKWTLIVLFIIILISSLSSTFGQQLLEDNPEVQTTADGTEVVIVEEDTVARQAPQGSTATDDFSNNVLQTIVHPRVLGMILFMLIGFFTMLLIAKSNRDPDD
jgi:hypothetical protein